MQSRHVVDPELVPFLESLPRLDFSFDKPADILRRALERRTKVTEVQP